MALGKSNLSARLRSSYTQLSSSAQSLNTASDELTKIVSSLDIGLKKLNLGIEAWVTISTGSDESGRYSYDDQLGYGKVNAKWGIAIRQLEGDELSGEERIAQEWLFADAPRDLRISVVDRLPELIEKLLKEVQHTNELINGKLADARGMLSALDQLRVESESPEVEK